MRLGDEQSTSRKRGRPAVNGVAMSAGERKRRQRVKERVRRQSRTPEQQAFDAIYEALRSLAWTPEGLLDVGAVIHALDEMQQLFSLGGYWLSHPEAVNARWEGEWGERPENWVQILLLDRLAQCRDESRETTRDTGVTLRQMMLQLTK